MLMRGVYCIHKPSFFADQVEQQKTITTKPQLSMTSSDMSEQLSSLASDTTEQWSFLTSDTSESKLAKYWLYKLHVKG